MKKPKIIKHTGVFLSMIENYRKSTSKILYQRKLDKSLNNYLLKDINKVKIKDNFPDEDYFINEIKLENKMKNRIKPLQNDTNKVPELTNHSYNDKINKDIFFYYKYLINRRNENKENNKQKLKKELKSLKSIKSHNTINSAKKSNSSYKNYSLATIILPQINSNNGNNKTPYKMQSKTIVEEEDDDDEHKKKIRSRNYERIKLSGKRRVENYLSYEKDIFNYINKENLLNAIRNYPHNHLLKLKLPLVTSNIFSKINEVSDISKNISRNINCLSNEEKIKAENEKNKIRFMDNLMT